MNTDIQFSCQPNRFDNKRWLWYCVVSLGEHACYSHGDGFPTLTGIGASKDQARQDAKEALLSIKADIDRALEAIDAET